MTKVISVGGWFRRPRARDSSVYGLTIAPPRPTREGVLFALRLFGPAALAFVLALDLIVWAIADIAFGACTAIWCVL